MSDIKDTRIILTHNRATYSKLIANINEEKLKTIPLNSGTRQTVHFLPFYSV